MARVQFLVGELRSRKLRGTGLGGGQLGARLSCCYESSEVGHLMKMRRVKEGSLWRRRLGCEGGNQQLMKS